MATQFTIQTPELDIFTARLREAPLLVAKSVNIAIDKSAKGVQLIARANAPKRTGKLAASITYNPLEGMKGIVYTRLNYGVFVHGGTGLYGPKKQLIVPKNKKVLATKLNPGFGSPNAKGFYIIGKSSKGQRPNPFMERASISARPLIDVAFAEAAQQIVKEIGG